MGLLDDAIREHLELKRQHGADPSEVAKQEAEVLGSPRTPTAPRGDAPAQAAEPEARPEADDPFEDRAEAAAPPAPAAPPPEPEPLPEEPRAPREEAHDVGQPTEAFTPEDLDWSDPAPVRDDEPEVVPADDEEGEDVLEETPEFLQETPEHDRLWFEQRPPRDFDF